MRYKITNLRQLSRRAQMPEDIDPRAVFYRAILSSGSYEEYIAAVGGNIAVYPKSYGGGNVPISAETEFKYVRDNRRWIKELVEGEEDHLQGEDVGEHLTMRDLVSRKAILRAIEEADRLGRDAFLLKYGFKPAREYVLKYHGKTYDSKAVAGAAFQFLYPGAIPLTPKDLNGGKKGAAGHLARLGFEVEGIDLDQSDWTYEEVAATVDDYFEMLTEVLAGRSINKAQHNSHLRTKLRNRTSSSVELKHQNISAVLARQELPWLPGYAPRANTQILLRAVVNDFVSEHPEIFDVVPGDIKPSPAEHIFVDPPSAKSFHEVSRERKGVKVDFGERDASNRKLGKAGEQWVFNTVRGILQKAGKHELADGVRWVSDEVGDGLGYDIAAFRPDGAPLFIEVKTTNGGIAAPFLVTANEVAVSEEEPEHYAIYRVFDFAKEPKVYVLHGPIGSSCDLKPCLWKALPK